MNAQDVVELLHESIRTSKQAGTTEVSIDRLEAFAHEVEKFVNEWSSQKRDIKRAIEMARELNKE